MDYFKEGLTNKLLPEKIHQLLLEDKDLWQLFPYVEFLKNPERPVLLTTIHKLLYGFFSGMGTERILGLENNIIFLDEFDMQEKEFLSFLCRSPEIQNSFEFVRLFYEEMTRQSLSGILAPSERDSEKRIKAKQGAELIVSKLRKDCEKDQFNFPQIRHFIMDGEEFHKDKLSVFQSSVQIMTDPFYLVEEETYWRIVRRKTAQTLRARRLIDLISRTTDQILRFFSELWADSLIPEWNSWIEQCYDQKNDNSPGRYKKIIGEYGFYHRPPKLSSERKEKEVSDSIYYKGYNFFRLVRNAYLTAPDEVRIDQKKLTISPEYIIWRVCQSNLVFALSATGDIKRYINSFDLNWLERSCNYLPIDETDKNIVNALKKAKESKRQYDIFLSIATQLPKNHPLNRALDQLGRDSFFQEDILGEDQDTAIKFRKRAVNLFLETLRWIVNESQNKSHLVFLNSFKYIEKLFQSNSGLPLSFYKEIEHYFEIHDIANSGNREYSIQFEAKDCQVIFLDAAKGREMEDQIFKQKQQGVPLVVVTTYPTASNGVNLKWIPLSDSGDVSDSKDFEGIHLLEAPHFYFNGKDDDDGDIDREKMFIWQIWKLFANHQISEKQFVVALRELNIGQVNQLYKNSLDYLLNQIAVFYQALGRVDRQWKNTSKMEVRLASGSPGVVELFEWYLTTPGVIAKERLAREGYTSSLIIEIHKQLKQQYIRKQVLNELQNEDLGLLESRCEKKIDYLLRLISGVRSGEYSDEHSYQIMQLWWQIREAVLKQDYHFQGSVEVLNLLTGREERLEIKFLEDFVHTSAFIQNDHEFYFKRATKSIYPYLSKDVELIDLNNFYRNFRQNDIIDWYFRTHNYKLQYETTAQNYIFTPFAMQAILAGAVGEAALKAVFDNFHIPMKSELECSPQLFELSDLQIKDSSIYIDAKNFSNWTTLYRFVATPGDPEYDERLNSITFLSAAQKKWHHIVQHTGDRRTKLVFINLLAGDNHPNEGWDENLNPIVPYSFADSTISVIQGVIKTSSPNDFRDPFLDWINAVKYQSLFSQETKND
ncbi:MAG: hypothetical protein M1511_02925 [Deltaproteobacteria bacterium]|nr:hypothetical protein [Deltaproteobacteria bacterium]